MTALFKKLLRNISAGKGQFFAVVAVVAIGIMVYISMSSTYYNLMRAQEDYYSDSNFADYYFHLVRAPEQIVKELEAIPGVNRVNGRISIDLSILKEDNQRATARLVSFAFPMENQLNRLQLEQGRFFEEESSGSEVEIMIDPGYFEANQLNWGDNVQVIFEGKPIDLYVTGTANSPEFIYPIKDISMMYPDHETFGIFMIPLRQGQQIFNLQGQINQIIVEFSPGADQDRVISEIKDLLKPYGDLASYPRDDQVSHAMLDAELGQLESQITVLPLIFLSIAAALQFVILRRMVKLQRTQIGVLKALGYNNRQIILHYSTYALLVGLMGAILGTVFAYLLAGAFTSMYAEFFKLPKSIEGLDLSSVISGFLIAILVSLAAGWSATRRIVRINPAEAMRAEPPKKGGRNFLEKWPWLWQKIRPDWKMSLRSISRNKGRFLLTVVGVVFSVGLLVVSYFTNDAVDYMMRKTYTEDQHYDLLVHFQLPIKESDLYSIKRIDGVMHLEPLLQLPIKIHFQGKEEEEGLIAYPLDLSLKRIVDEKDRELMIPEDGILLNQRTANKLGIKTGDIIEIETLLNMGPIRRSQEKVVGLNYQIIGGASYIEIGNANRILNEAGLLSGIMMQVEDGKIEDVEKELNKFLAVSSVLSLQRELENFEDMLDVLIYAVSMMVLFAVVLGFAIVYNASVMSFMERERELASLRVIGYTTQEVSAILSKENLLQSLLGIMIGLPFGRFMVEAYTKSIETDLYSLPVVIYPTTYLFSAITAIVFVNLAHHFATHGIKKLNLVEVLKERD